MSWPKVSLEAAVGLATKFSVPSRTSSGLAPPRRLTTFVAVLSRRMVSPPAIVLSAVKVATAPAPEKMSVPPPP